MVFDSIVYGFLDFLGPENLVSIFKVESDDPRILQLQGACFSIGDCVAGQGQALGLAPPYIKGGSGWAVKISRKDMT